MEAHMDPDPKDEDGYEPQDEGNAPD